MPLMAPGRCTGTDYPAKYWPGLCPRRILWRAVPNLFMGTTRPDHFAETKKNRPEGGFLVLPVSKKRSDSY